MIQEVREATHMREFTIKSRVAKLYNQKDLVLRKMIHKAENNKLTPRWEGPFRVTKEVGRGAYRLETLKGKEIPRTWNAASLRMTQCVNKVGHGFALDKSYKSHLYGRPWIRLG
ncbi:hypothetical protein CR513_57663, partial [Mucuna pruriens]